MRIFRKARYMRYKTKKIGSLAGALITITFYFFAIVLGICLIVNYWKFLLTLTLVILGIFLIFQAIRYFWMQHANSKHITQSIQDKSVQEQTNIYSSKNHLMTPTEMKFFEVFQEIVGSNYIVQPQINLASIIEKIKNINIVTSCSAT